MFASPQEELIFARRLVLDQGKVMGNFFSKGSKDSTKPDGSPVTDADEEISDNVVAAYRARGSKVATEERGGTATYGERDVFVLDPIDGTTNFINGQKLRPRVSLAMISLARLREQVDMAVGYAALLSEPTLYTATRGGGLYRERGGKRTRIKINTTPHTGVVLVSDGATKLVARLRAMGFATMDFNGAVFKGSALADPTLINVYQPGRLALGMSVVGFISGRTMPHDHLGTGLFVTEAGGIATSPTGGPLGIRSDDRGCVMANNPVVHKQLLAAVSR